MLQSVWKNRELIAQMMKREVIGRYRGSVSVMTIRLRDTGF